MAQSGQQLPLLVQLRDDATLENFLASAATAPLIEAVRRQSEGAGEERAVVEGKRPRLRPGRDRCGDSGRAGQNREHGAHRLESHASIVVVRRAPGGLCGSGRLCVLSRAPELALG